MGLRPFWVLRHFYYTVNLVGIFSNLVTYSDMNREFFFDSEQGVVFSKLNTFMQHLYFLKSNKTLHRKWAIMPCLFLEIKAHFPQNKFYVMLFWFWIEFKPGLPVSRRSQNYLTKSCYIFVLKIPLLINQLTDFFLPNPTNAAEIGRLDSFWVVLARQERGSTHKECCN